MTQPGLLWSLLEPIGKAVFLDEYWERNWLHVDGAKGDAIVDLVSLGDLEQLLFDADGSGHPIYAVGNLLDGGEKAGRSAPNDLVGAWFRGKTLVFQELDRRLPRLSDFTRRLEADLSHRLRCNLYLTPPQAQGFKAHYDPHDIFVLQLMGAKRWRVGKRLIECPLPTQTFDVAAPQTEVEAPEIMLRPGDILYLPGGWLHEARSADDISCHLTFGIVSETYLDLILAAAVNAALRDPDFRHQLPPDTEPSAAVVLDLVSRITRDDVAEALRTLREKATAAQPPPSRGRLGLVKSIGAIGADDRVHVNASARPQLRSKPGAVELHGFGKCLVLAARLAPALHYCLQEQVFTVGSIPGEIDLDDKIALVRRLLIEGFLNKIERR